MLEIVKHNKSYIEHCSKFSDLFTKEYYFNLLSDKKILELCKFNTPELISRDIKEKTRIYHIIKYENEIIGYVLTEKKDEMLNISQIFVLKRYRKQGLFKKIIEEIKDIANDLKDINIYIAQDKKAIQKIFEMQGFKKTQEIAQYIGDDVYIFEFEYCLKL